MTRASHVAQRQKASLKLSASTSKANVAECSADVGGDRTAACKGSSGGDAEPIGGLGSDGCGRPFDFWLKFHNQELERLFWIHRSDQLLLRLERFCFANIVLEALYTWWQLSNDGLWASPLLHCSNAFAVLASSWATLHAHHRTKWYVSNRSSIVGMLRVLLYAVMVWDMVRLPPPAPSAVQFIAKMLLKSSVPGLFYGALLLQLQFRLQLLVAGVCLILATVLGCPGYCDLWYAQDELPVVFNSIYHKVDTAVSTISLGGWGTGSFGGTACQCCVVVSYMHAALGLVLPSAIMYCWECHAKLSFLRTRKLIKLELAKWTFHEALVLSVWFTLIALMALWNCIRFVPLGLMIMASSCPLSTGGK